MTRHYDKQEIAQLLSKFMTGETTVAEEQLLAQYFRTHEEDEEWKEYKEMFALFDNGQVDIGSWGQAPDPVLGQRSCPHDPLPKAVKTKPKIIALRWLVAGIAASIALLLAFHLGNNTAVQTPLTAQHTITADSTQFQPDSITTEPSIVAQAEPMPPIKPTTVKRHKAQPKAIEPMDTGTSAAESLANCIARLEAEMESLDDSVNSEQVEKLIAADVRLQQMVNRIVGKQVEQAINEIKSDSTANYIYF